MVLKGIEEETQYKIFFMFATYTNFSWARSGLLIQAWLLKYTKQIVSNKGFFHKLFVLFTELVVLFCFVYCLFFSL